jgi:hypothetical protein
MEFHISRRIREKFDFDDTLFSYDGNVIFANFHAARVFVQKVNAQKDLISFPEKAIKTSQVNAMGLIDEIFHHIFRLYREQKNPNVLNDLYSSIQKSFPADSFNQFLEIFVKEYPPSQVFKKQITSASYLLDSTDGTPNRELLLEELIMLWLMYDNPALEHYSDLYYEKSFIEDPRFEKTIKWMRQFFSKQPKFGPANEPLVEMLKSPSLKVPNSITGQLEYICEHWAALLGDYLYRLLSSLDFISEENKQSFDGPGPTLIPVYDQSEFTKAGGSAGDVEAFSLDREWMPRLVLIAKNSYVWLDQLSKKYRTSITHLDQIPDSELETLSRWGITGLWLIGLWERSPASARIKQLCGNPEAISSAYSLHSYEIANDLGGVAAYEKLRDNAARFGIRLASDMVPNHMGIDSDWMIHNPDRFLALDDCPYPSYSFNGENLSANPDVTIQIEDHYFDRTDAAVVFKRQDNRTGAVKYIYHGNDGTSMPWNDTAQLNYLNPEVREAVIQTIIEVARKFPIIRFDAAMTLAKKHFQRLWFPQPGSGGAIPSRAEYGMTMEAFNKAMPVEFWREVVDRVAVEAPDTLLLAEAFWLMEGYFVRTLGMHRVYNSAFMNMLRNEDNAGYRKLVTNTLEFEPEILKRYVNFMNNPDERTAVDQFGKGDKYFGICVLMATLPGLPMLGHGQIEGFSEKYGMEFRKAYWEEAVDQDLVARHEWDVFPLLHQRRLFAGVENFHFYDYVIGNSQVNENVYAYSNRDGDKSALIVYNNNFQETSGSIHYSVRQTRRVGNAKKIEQVPLAEALDLPADPGAFLVFRDQITKLQFIRPMSEILQRGMYFKLRGYQYYVLMEFHIVHSDSLHDYDRLYRYIGNQGVTDINKALSELVLRPIQDPFKAIVDYEYLNYLAEKYSKGNSIEQTDTKELEQKTRDFINGIAAYTGKDDHVSELVDNVTQQLLASFELMGLPDKSFVSPSKKATGFLKDTLHLLTESNARWMSVISWVVCNSIGLMDSKEHYESRSSTRMDEWQLNRIITETLQQTGTSEAEIQQMLSGIKVAIAQQNWYEMARKMTMQEIIRNWLSDPEIQNFLRVNRYQSVLWYNRESFEELIWWMSIVPIIKTLSGKNKDAASLTETLLNLNEIISKLKKAEKQSEFQFEKLVELLSQAKF